MSKSNKPRNFLQQFKALGRPVITGDTSAKVFFLLLSIFLWFLIKLSKEGYSTTVEFPLNYYNFPADRKLMNDLPEFVEVEVRGKGFEILGAHFRDYKAYELNVAETDSTGTGRSSFDLSQAQIHIQSEISDNLDLLGMAPRQVAFEFEKLYSKKVKVYLKGIRRFKDFKDLYHPPQFSPDSILVTGPKSAIAGIDSIFTEPITLKADKDSLTREVQLVQPKQEGVNFSHKKVRVKLDFTSITEGSIKIPLELKGVPAENELTIFPDQVEVIYRVAVRDFDRVEAEDFKAYVDFGEVENPAEDRFLRVRMRQTPAMIRKFQLKPRKVEFILRNK